MTSETARGALARAEAALDVGRTDEALRLTALALAEDPDSGRAWCITSLAHLRSNNAQAALDAANRAVTCSPDSEWGHRLAAISLGALGMWPDALRAALRSRELAPYTWQTHLQVSRAYRGLGDLPQAMAAATEAARLAPDEAEVHVNVGICALKQGDRDGADVAFRRALSIDPNNVAARNELARVSLGRRDYGAAASGFFDAARMDPREEAARYNLDLTLRIFLARIAYAVMIGAWVGVQIGRTGTDASSAGVRAGAAVGLVAAGGFAFYRYRQTVQGMSPAVRRYLLDRVRRSALAFGVAPIALSLVLLAAVLGSPTSIARGLLGAAFGCALIGRIVLWAERHRHIRSGANLPRH